MFLYKPAMSAPRQQRSSGGAVLHNLFVQIVDPHTTDAAAQKGRQLTLQALQYIHSRLQVLATMGIKVRVNKIRKSDLANPRLVAAMKKEGITRLPALVTPNNVYVGNREIMDVYEKNVKEFEAWNRRDEKKVSGLAPEDDLRSFYAEEMTFERAAHDQDGAETMGETSDMMDSYRKMMVRREQSAKHRTPGRPAPASLPAEHQGAPASLPAEYQGAPAPRRADNVSLNPENDPDTAMLIDRLAADIDSQTFDQAFSGGGGDTHDSSDRTGSAQDDLMEAAFWANQDTSM
jgi:hypothetical protein